MIYSVADIVSFASQNLTLLPRDVILTGTPSGVGPIRAGDQLEARIGDWPALRNRVRDAARRTGKSVWKKIFCALALHPARLDNSIVNTQVNFRPNVL